MKHNLLGLSVIIVCLLLANCLQAGGTLSQQEMSSIYGKGCGCTGVVEADDCPGSGLACSFCNCTGDYIAAGGTLYACTGNTGDGECSDSTATCTHTVICKPGAAFDNKACSGEVGCYPVKGHVCVLCNPSSTENKSTTQTCG